MKSERHRAIVELIASEEVETQEFLRERLKQKGFRVTQATLSRDLRELGVAKVPNEEGARYRLPESGAAAALPRVVREFAGEVRQAGNLLVIRTEPGHASSVAFHLDGAGWKEIVGTVAGDDTIFAACRNPAAARRARERLLALREGSGRS